MAWSPCRVLPNGDAMIVGDSAGQTMGCTQTTGGLDSAPSVYFQCKELFTLSHWNILHLQASHFIHLILQEKIIEHLVTLAGVAHWIELRLAN